jgi:hypothetical protein
LSKIKIITVLSIGFLATFLHTNVSVAQSQDSVRYGFFPSFSYDSDNGINISIDLQRFDYSDGIQPFNNYSKYRLSYKGIGAYTFSYYRDQVQTFGTDKRSAFDLLINQNYGNYFTGYTLDGEFNRDRFDNSDYYQFDSFLLNIGAETRLPITAVEGVRRTDIKIGLRVVHEKPFDHQTNSYMTEVQPIGWNGSAYTFAEVGYIKEARDNEFRSQQGYLFTHSFKTSIPGLSETWIGQLYTDLRMFKQFTEEGAMPEVILGQRLLNNYTMGEIPYWFAPFLGGNGALRGFMYRRFVGEASILSITELRTWLFELPWLDSDVGFNLFVDNGAVYKRDFSDWTGGTSYGFGGFMSIFSRDFILKYEMGFSEDGAAVYLGSGFSF